jgi:hypothetical protein
VYGPSGTEASRIVSLVPCPGYTEVLSLFMPGHLGQEHNWTYMLNCGQVGRLVPGKSARFQWNRRCRPCRKRFRRHLGAASTKATETRSARRLPIEGSRSVHERRRDDPIRDVTSVALLEVMSPAGLVRILGLIHCPPCGAAR